MEAISFRPIRADDEAFLYRVYASTRTAELAPVPWTDEQKTAFLKMQFTAQHTHYQSEFPNAAFQVILRGEVPVGRLYVHRRTDEIGIVDIALLPEHQRSGIGSAILRDILDEGARTGMPVRIYVERFNPALHLYERLGFRRCGDLSVYYHMEWLPPPTA